MESLSDLCWLVSNQMIQPCPILSILSFQFPIILDLTDSSTAFNMHLNENDYVEWKRSPPSFIKNQQVSIRRLYSSSFTEPDTCLRKWVLKTWDSYT